MVTVVCWMFVSVKKMMSRRKQPSDSAPCRCPQRRPPSTPPLPLRTRQLVAKQPETAVVLRDRRKFKGQGSVVRESWPGARLMTFDPLNAEPRSRTTLKSLTPLSRGQPITEARPKATDQPQCHMTPSAPHPHWSVPVRAPPSGRGSEATMMSLLLFCHR